MSMTTAKPVVVGIDGFDRGERILEWAVAEAFIWQAPLHVVTVWNWDCQSCANASSRRRVSSLGSPAGWARQVQETLIARVLARFGSPAPPVIPEVAEGDPATQLIRRSRDAELLIIGGDPTSRELGTYTVAEVCRRYAGCPVAVLPATGRVPAPIAPQARGHVSVSS
jgi:nucleotide-binding universal stress UspA family protein